MAFIEPMHCKKLNVTYLVLLVGFSGLSALIKYHKLIENLLRFFFFSFLVLCVCRQALES